MPLKAAFFYLSLSYLGAFGVLAVRFLGFQCSVEIIFSKPPKIRTLSLPKGLFLDHFLTLESLRQAQGPGQRFFSTEHFQLSDVNSQLLAISPQPETPKSILKS
jgi:hypothetical protein